MDVAWDWWRSLTRCRPLGFLAMTWTQFFEAFLERFVPFNLRDQMRDEFDHLEQGSMSIAKDEARLHALARFLAASISSKYERIQKFIKGLDGSYQLATTQMVVSGASFQSITEHTKMTESII